jgi:hypothetical protein
MADKIAEFLERLRRLRPPAGEVGFQLLKVEGEDHLLDDLSRVQYIFGSFRPESKSLIDLTVGQRFVISKRETTSDKKSKVRRKPWVDQKQ